MFRLVRPPVSADPRGWLAEVDYDRVTDIDDLRRYLKPAMDDGRIVGADSETHHFNAFVKNPVAGYSLSISPGSARYVPVGHLEHYQHNLPLADVLQVLADLDKRCDTCWFNYFYDGTVNLVTNNLTLTRWQDTLIAVILQDCEQQSHGLKKTAQRLLGVTMPTFASVVAGEDDEDEQVSFAALDPTAGETLIYACADADVNRRIWLDKRVAEKRGQQQAIYDLERAFLPVFQRAMLTGCWLDDAALAAVEYDIGAFQKVKGKIKREMRPDGRLAKLDAEVRRLLGCGPDVNFNATGQLAVALTAAGIPLTELTDGGALSTSVKVLAELAKHYPAVEMLIEWKKLEALDRNYVRKLRAAHATFGSHVRFPFRQYGAPTGRMSCGGDGKKAEKMAAQGYVNVNVQSLPDSDKEEYLPDIRMALVPDDPLNPDPDPWSLVAIDFSQLQLRIAANVSREPRWVKAYVNGEDLHMENTRAAYNDPKMPKLVQAMGEDGKPAWSPDGKPVMIENPKRKLGKTMNFAVLFGSGEETVAKAGKIVLAEAKRLLENFWRNVPVLSNWIEQTHRRARLEKVVRTWLGRQRPLHAYYAPDAPRFMQSKGDRESVNHQIQGGEADLFKIACIRADKVIEQRGWREHAMIMLFVHDELVFRVRTRLLQEIVPALLTAMEAVRMPGCPVAFTCDAAYGAGWGTALREWPREKAEPVIPAVAAASRPQRPANPPMVAPPAAPSFARPR